MISSISSNAGVQGCQSSTQSAGHRAPVAQQRQDPQDTVQLSAAAQAGSGDVDNDGDSR